MKQSNLLLFAAGGLALWYFARGKKPTRWEQLTYLNGWAAKDGDYTADEKEFITTQFVQMTDQELFDTYTFIHDYWENGRKEVPAGSALSLRMIAISNKYNIFT